VCFFLFAIKLATEMGFTDDCYTDGRVPSVRPLGIISPTDFIPVTDGISPLVKLFNGVVLRGYLYSIYTFTVCSVPNPMG